MSASNPKLVHLAGGMIVPLEPYELVLHLERIGVRLTVEGGDLVVEGTVSSEVLAQLRRWKPHVIMLLRYIVDDCSLQRLAVERRPA